ncbi:putative c6 transcription factor [Phaeomoniella chlamydospora]|uniref:Putative c6 transcription factor n=1 Tax=Phaeomoniella chlamydospora TaxID=158046 RepID=A0A0G2EEB3_PHACM|nr:putative c6 transcription factor [Phaeomoniella chlamydospora]
MAACALASARVRDGAVYSPRWDVAQLQQPPSEVFFAVAEQAIPPDYTSIYSNHNILRIFFTLCDIGGLHDESNWPKNVGFVELEERRRVIWSMYTLNVYTSVIWAGIMRVREGQADVAYPTEVDDEMFDDNGIKPTEPTSATVSRQGSPTSANAPATKENCWISGWNFTTDLYRILEHACNNFRSRRSRQHHETFLCDIFGDVNASQASVLQSINTMYANLPPRFKHTNPINLDTTEDRFGFQAANITATMQLLRMVLFAVGGGTLDQKCQIASDVINSFLNIPIAYLRAISTPLLHHLAGIGQILGSVFEEPLCERDYMQVRTVLLSMAQLLANLDVGLSPDERASEKVRAQVARIDDYMATLRHHDHSIRELRRQQFRTTGSGSSGTGPIGKPSSRYPSISMENDKPNAGIHITSSSQYDKPPTTDSQPDSSNYHPNHPVPSSITPSSGRGSKLPSLSSTLNNNNNNHHHSNVSTGPLTDSPMTNIPHQLPPELFEDWPWCFAPTMDFAFPGSGGVSIGGLITGDGGIGSGTGTDTTRGEGGTSSLTSISFTGQGGLQGGIINGYGHGFQMMGGGHIP